MSKNKEVKNLILVLKQEMRDMFLVFPIPIFTTYTNYVQIKKLKLLESKLRFYLRNEWDEVVCWIDSENRESLSGNVGPLLQAVSFDHRSEKQNNFQLKTNQFGLKKMLRSWVPINLLKTKQVGICHVLMSVAETFKN